MSKFSNKRVSHTSILTPWWILYYSLNLTSFASVSLIVSSSQRENAPRRALCTEIRIQLVSLHAVLINALKFYYLYVVCVRTFHPVPSLIQCIIQLNNTFVGLQII